MKAILSKHSLAKLRVSVKGYGQEIADATGFTRQYVRSVLLGHGENEQIINAALEVQKKVQKLKATAKSKRVAA